MKRRHKIVPMSELQTRYYIRLTVVDQPGVLAQIACASATRQISIASVIQKETHVDAGTAELVIMTHEAREASMQQALQAVRELPAMQRHRRFPAGEEE